MKKDFDAVSCYHHIISIWRNCIRLRYNFYQGTQQFMLLDSHQILQARICYIFKEYGLKVFL